MEAILGVDTSNYTTSVAALHFETGELLGEVRQLLPVPEGERGLRQSDALFHHVVRLPSLLEELQSQVLQLACSYPKWRGVGVSVHPRPMADSYMPVFHAGVSFAHAFASLQRVPVVRTSHQEGHVAAALFAMNGISWPIIAVHLSGGTSDVLFAKQGRWGYHIEPIGEGADLHAGQFIDRVGVALGLPFPSGPALERLANTFVESPRIRFPSHVDGARMSFSGPCTAALRAVADGHQPAEIAKSVQDCVANTVVKAVRSAFETNPQARTCVIAGGVASNQAIAHRVTHRLRIECPNLMVRFAPPHLASDNAIGPAVVARRGLVETRLAGKL